MALLTEAEGDKLTWMVDGNEELAYETCGA